MAKKNLIRLDHISKRYGDHIVLDDLSLEVGENEFITLLGPSGCGKTTTLRIIGGFETPDSGRVFFDGKDITDLPPNERPLNTVFQKYALFPHMNVFENVAFGLRVSKKPEDFIRGKVKQGLKLVNLEGFENRRIDELSGGQQQRIAMARAIVNEPKLLLLDEPLGALDLKLREELEYELKLLKEKLGITFIYVTHDQEEALTMSDKVVVLNGGYIQQMGTPEEIYNEPENAFVAAFIGDSNIFDALMVRDKLVRIFGVDFPCVDTGFGENNPVDVVIRPEDIIIGKPGEGKVDGVVTSNIFIGVHYEMLIQAGGHEWLAQNTTSYPVGTEVSLDVIPFNIQIMHKPESEDEQAMDLEEM
ncbi:MAG: ABC transporter ATP-binding protein [Eubacteriales bacterium]|nr:ABC transporter ATP-binding protein [Eubacteriales bacterium]